jgi:hypothetical protein
MKWIVVLAVIIVLLAPFAANLYTDFVPKRSGYVEDVRYLSVAVPPDVDKLERCFRTHGDRKDPARNFRTSSCVKLDHTAIAASCPFILDHFFTDAFAARCAAALGVPKLHLNSPARDVNCIFLRRYVEGDHLAFHYDNNFSTGTRYTAVVPLVVNARNTSEFLIKDAENRIHIVPIPLGRAVVYNGWQMHHAITGQRRGGERIVVVVHLYDTDAMNWWGHCRKAARDATYRALKL